MTKTLRLFNFLIPLLSTLLLPSLVAAAEKTESRPIAAFESISLAIPADVSYRVADTVSLKITAPSVLLPSISSTVKNGELALSMGNPGSAQNHKKSEIRIEISSPSLRAISLVSSGDLVASGLRGGELGLVLAGSGDVKLAGEVESFTINLSGSGDIDAAKLKAKKLNIDLFGSGDIAAFASQSARVHVMGAGDVTVAGNPPEQIREAHGPGEIIFKP